MVYFLCFVFGYGDCANEHSQHQEASEDLEKKSGMAFGGSLIFVFTYLVAGIKNEWMHNFRIECESTEMNSALEAGGKWLHFYV